MKTVWTKHLNTKEDKEALEKSILGSVVALKALTGILESKKKKPTQEDYNNPSWPYFRADLDGYNRALNDIISILDINKMEK